MRQDILCTDKTAQCPVRIIGALEYGLSLIYCALFTPARTLFISGSKSRVLKLPFFT